MKKSNILFFLFLAVSLFHLIGLWIQAGWIFYTKPMLMPLLLVFIYESSQPNVTKTTLYLAGAVIASWLGDIALLYEGDTFFLLGVGSFFIAQVIYIFLFNHTKNAKSQITSWKIVPYILYAGVLLYIIIPRAPADLIIPITIYGVSLVWMTVAARKREGTTSVRSFQLTSIGSILFLLSDSLLAIDKFVLDIPFGSFLVMTTYLAAQALISKGILVHK